MFANLQNIFKNRKKRKQINLQLEYKQFFGKLPCFYKDNFHEQIPKLIQSLFRFCLPLLNLFARLCTFVRLDIFNGIIFENFPNFFFYYPILTCFEKCMAKASTLEASQFTIDVSSKETKKEKMLKKNLQIKLSFNTY